MYFLILEYVIFFDFNSKSFNEVGIFLLGKGGRGKGKVEGEEKINTKGKKEVLLKVKKKICFLKVRKIVFL